MGLPRLRAALAVLVCSAWAGSAGAQERVSYADFGPGGAPVERTLVIGEDGSLALEVANRRFEVSLGSERVIVVGNPDVLEQEGVIVDEVLSRRAQIYAVRSDRAEGALALASRLAPLVQSGRIRAATPDLALAHVVADIAIPPSDPRYPGQWFFERIGIEDAWRRQDGDPSVTIAVIDNGCDLAHPDLAAHFLPGYDALDDDDDPTYSESSGGEHGTACAGLVAAVSDNALDVAGACPECTLRCIRLLGPMGTLIPIASDVRAFDFALEQGVAVVSNSWGFEEGTPVPGPLRAVIERIQVEGRGGLGAVVVFAAGNDASVIGPDELQAVAGVLTVGAINTFDEAASFSNSGDSVAVVAPTGSLTTDISGASGADPGDVTNSFGGTSSACPIVAGIAGLLVAERPELTAAMIREAIVASVRPAPFATPDAMGHDALYGYGIVDPAPALERISPQPVDAGSGDVDAGATPVASASGCGCTVVGRGVMGSRGDGAWLSSVLWVIALSSWLRRRRSR